MKTKTLLTLFMISALSQAATVDFAKLRSEYKRPTEIPYLDDNKYTSEKELLGKMLFFDPRLSGSNSISCATCHNPSFSWGDGLPKAVGHSHKVLGRKTPTILNMAWTEKMMWDGRFSHLEGQALGPIGSPDEMNMSLQGEGSLVDKLNQIKGYKELFAKAFPGKKISLDLIAKAIAVYERGVVSGEAPFDRFIAGDEKAISESAKNGFVVFNTKANCVSCHSGWNFTDDSFHDIGVKGNDIGRGAHLKLQSQQYAFKTPGLRNIALRGPFMHDGSEDTLKKVIDFYDRGGDVSRPSLSGIIKPLKLSSKEKKDLEAFLLTLNGDDKKVDLPILPR